MNTVPFKPRNFYGHTKVDKQKAFVREVREALDIDIENDMDAFVTRILESSYEAVSVDEVAKKQQHLTESQQEDLARLLKKFKKLFSGN